MLSFSQKIWQACRKIPRGRVSTYLEIARFIQNPKAVRAVGSALNQNPFTPKVPCHRVVKSDGCVGGFARGTRQKIKLLKKEGIKIRNGKIMDFEKVLFKFRK